MKSSQTPLVFAVLALSLGSCKMSEPPKVSAQGQVVTQYIWRGVPMSARPAAQGSLTTNFEAKDDDRLRITSWGSMSLTAGNGDALFGDSEIFDLDESRIIADYSHSLDHAMLKNFHFGVINYNYSALGGSTREIYAGTSWTYKELSPSVMLYWDIDERDGMYLNGAVESTFDFNEDVPGYWKVGLGFGTSRFNRNLYGDPDAGFADLTAELGATKELNKNTQARGFAAVSNLFVDDAALDAASIETLNFWIGVGMNWSF